MAREVTYRLDGVDNFRLLNFATGSYNCNCVICKNNFVGDARAVMCLSCAIKAVEEKFTSTNSASTKFPTLVEVIKNTVVEYKTESYDIYREKLRTAKQVYDYIVRNYRA